MPEAQSNLQNTPQTGRQRLFLGLKFVLLLALIGLQYYLPQWVKENSYVLKYLNALLFYLIGTWLTDFARLLVIALYRRRRLKFAQPNFVIGINQIASIITFLIALIAASILLEVNLGQVFTSLSIVAAAIAIVFKDYISNFINGLIIMFTDEFTLEDDVEVGKHRGRIADITLIHVQLITEDEELVFVPNNMMMNSEVVNYTRRAVNRYGFEFTMGFSYLNQIRELEVFLDKSLQDFADWIEPNSLNLKTMEIQKDSARLKYQYTLKEPDKEKEKRIRRRIARRIIEFVSGTNPDLEITPGLS